MNNYQLSLRKISRSVLKSDVFLDGIHSVAIGMDNGASLLTTWAYSVEMGQEHGINRALFNGVILSVYSLPLLFLDGYRMGQQPQQRNKKKRKKRRLYFMLISQTFSLFGCSMYACSFSPLLVVFGRMGQGFLTLKFGNFFPVSNEQAKKDSCYSGASYGFGVVLSSLVIGLSRNLNFQIGGKIRIQYGNLSAVNLIFTLIVMKLFTVATINRRRIAKIASKFYGAKNNYGSYVKHYKVKAKHYKSLQENDERKKLTVRAFKVSDKLNWLEKLHLAVTEATCSREIRKFLYTESLSQFAISLSLFVWMILLEQRFGIRSYLSNSVITGTFGVTYMTSNLAVLFGFFPYEKVLSNSALSLGYPFYFIGTVIFVQFFQTTRITATAVGGSCFALSALLMTAHRQKHLQVVSKQNILKKEVQFTEFDFYRTDSIVNSIAVVCAAFMSSYFCQLGLWSTSGYAIFSLIAVGMFMMKIK